jgi:Mrp family chromosome partitioning ATPase
LLIDGDVIRPSLSGMFGLADRKGLMDAVVDATIDPESLIAQTSVEGLSILPAGAPNENATEHFASSRMHEVIEQLMSVPNRLIVLDSLPLLLSTEARVLAPHAGQVLLVVRAESTPKPAVRQALALLAEHKNVKVLLNAVIWTKMLDYMVYGYGYGYEYGAVENGKKT